MDLPGFTLQITEFAKHLGMYSVHTVLYLWVQGVILKK